MKKIFMLGVIAITLFTNSFCAEKKDQQWWDNYVECSQNCAHNSPPYLRVFANTIPGYFKEATQYQANCLRKCMLTKNQFATKNSSN